MSTSDFDSDFDAVPDRDDFDRDDDLRALLRTGDPAASLPPAEPAALAGLLEDIMSADLDVRPDADTGNRATGTHGRNRLTWLVAAAAAAVIAGVGGYAVTGLGGGSTAPQAGDDPSTTGDSSIEALAPLAGQTTSLTVSDQQGRCHEATPEILAQYSPAFAGTVTAIEGDTVTLETTEVFNGEVGETVQVTAPPALFNTLINTVDFEVGGSYLVAAFEGQASMCYSGPATSALRSPYEKAFVR